MKIIGVNDNDYSNMLKKLKRPPKKLYIEGNSEIINTNCIGIVGSRDCTEYGEKWCKFFVEELVKYGLTIVSGMALGIDSIAHNTAINAGGNTIAVFPSGLDNIYPEENMYLYKKILKNGGTVITEYEPNEEADSKKFLKRNRIVSGLSIGILVIEAAYRSGTSVTAKYAKKQGRDVFCIPRKP